MWFIFMTSELSPVKFCCTTMINILRHFPIYLPSGISYWATVGTQKNPAYYNSTTVMRIWRDPPLQWRHNKGDEVSNGQHDHVLLNRLCESEKKNRSSASLALFRQFTGDRWIPRTNWPVAGKMFPFDDVIMSLSVIVGWSDGSDSSVPQTLRNMMIHVNCFVAWILHSYVSE